MKFVLGSVLIALASAHAIESSRRVNSGERFADGEDPYVDVHDDMPVNSVIF